VLGLIRSRSARRATHATAAAARPQLGRLDRVQAAWLTFVTLLAIGSVIYWIGIGIIAVFGVPALFDISLDDIRNIFDDIRNIWVVIPIALFLIVAEAIRKTFIEPFDQQGVEAFAGLEYQLDDKRFLAVPNAILDAIGYARNRGYGSVDLLAFSLGSLLATDAIFPRQKRERVWSPPLAIENWITIGYPYDLIHWQRPDYFDRRQNPVVEFRHWINVVVKDDFLGTTFTKGDERGIRVLDSREVYAPDKPLQPFRPEGHVEPDPWWDLIRPLRRAINHRVYWDDEDARAPTCFREVVHKAGWTEEVLTSLTGPPPSRR
jgi:hypothetical protein